jgi:virginiamycin B lyase
MKRKLRRLCFFLLLAMAALQALSLEALNLKEFTVSHPGFMIVAGPDQALWYTHAGDIEGVSRITISGEHEVIDVPGSLNWPWGVVLTNNGDLWFTDARKPIIRRLSKDRVWTEFVVPAPALGITEGADGNLWFNSAQQVGRLEPSGAVKMFPVASGNSLLGPMASGPDGNLWFTDQANLIWRMDLSGNAMSFPLRDASWPFSITVGPDGHLWFTQLLGNRIGRLSTTGMLTEFELPHSQSVPDQIVAGPDGNLWFTEHRDRIGRITTKGAITEFAIPASYGDASGLAFGPDGNLWVVFLYPHNQPKVVRMTLGGTPVNGPCTASDTILCIDDTQGDRRFQVEVEYETAQAGGLAGKGKAIPLASLGVARGGLFWFFSEDNPELVVKILNGCATNQKYWVFISGGTNVGLIITVSDTVTGEVHTYYNRENTPFAPIQDTSALSCGS